MTRSIIAILCLAGSVALFFLYTKPAYDSMQLQKAQIKQYDLALSKANELQRLKQSLLSRYNTFSPEDLDRLHKLLPDHVDNVRLVLDVDTLAARYGLALQNVVITGQASDPQEEAAIIGPDQSEFDSLTLRFATTGSYQQFVTFLSELEHSLRVVDVAQLKMDYAPGATAGGEPLYRYDLTVRTYWLK